MRRRLEREKAAGSTARDLMSVVLVSISPEATVAEAARRMHRANIRRFPVLGERGRLVGIVSRGDLLKVFNRPGQAIQREIIDEVIVGEFTMDPDRFFIHVHDGVAVLEGRVERRSLLPYLVRAVRQVENRLAYDIDDVEPSSGRWSTRRSALGPVRLSGPGGWAHGRRIRPRA
jgi:predicted transcriptional regulator